MRQSTTLLLALICTVSMVQAQPKFFRVMWNDDPTTTLVVGWSQDLISAGNGSDFQLYYATEDYGTDLSRYETANTPIAPQRTVEAVKGLDHYYVRLTGLQPKTAYYFVISYDNPTGTIQTTERYWMRTASNDPADPVSIVAGGDSRLNVDGGPVEMIKSITIRQEANRIVAKLRPDLVAFGGDYTFANTEAEWIQWFQDWELTYTEDNKITPIVAAIGNHEHSPFGCPDCGNQVIYNLFDTPNPDNYYALTFGGNLLRLYTLNTEMPIVGDQSEWLLGDLETHDLNTHWKMAQYHKPMRPHEAGKSDKNDAFENWALPFYEKQVRLVIECDAHVVKQTWPLIPTTSTDGETPCQEPVDHNFYRTYNGRGTTYAGEGTWAAIRTANDPKEWTRDMGTLNQVKWIWIYRDQIQLRTAVTFKEEDPGYAANVEALDELNRFRVPEGLELWTPENGEVLSIYNNGLTPVPGNCEVTGVQENHFNSQAQLHIMPNPTKDKRFTITLRGTAARSTRFALFNLQGKKVAEYAIESQNGSLSQNIQLTDQPPGVYIVEATTDDSATFIQRLVLK